MFSKYLSGIRHVEIKVPKSNAAFINFIIHICAFANGRVKMFCSTHLQAGLASPHAATD